MSTSCTYGAGRCLMFPIQKLILILPTLANSIASLAVGSVNNGMYVCPISKYINLTVVSSGKLEYYNINHTNLTTIKTNYVKGIANSMTITATQSPNVFLRNYMNTATIRMIGLYSDPYITAFYLHVPSDIVTFDSTYCNATLGSNANNPYPTRLNCWYENDTTIAITIPEGVTYLLGFTDGYAISINCKFYIKDFSAGQDTLYVSSPVISGTFNAYGSYSNQIDDYHYYIT